MKLSMTIAFGCMLLVTPVNAEDWNGFYAGLNGSSATGSYLNGVSALDQEGVDIAVDGLIGGATIGYNWNAGTYVYGIEADYSTGPSGITPQGTNGPFWLCGSGDCNASIDDFGTVRARVGVVEEGSLIYATAGYAFGNVTGGIYDSPQQGGGQASGWAAGIGIETPIMENVTGKMEFLHVDLGAIPFGTGQASEDTFDGVGSFDVIRVGVNYQF